MELYSIKMRGSKGDEHISGAEKIVKKENIDNVVKALINRAFTHKKGKSNFINIKIEKIDEEEISYINKLSVVNVESKNVMEAKEIILEVLESLKLDKDKGERILNELYEIRNMRGAKIINIDTLKRMDLYEDRGVRVTFMDKKEEDSIERSKNHFSEAIILASKVLSCKNIVGELCISDDLDYTTGYITTKELGYVRIPNIKKLGEDIGGRIFLFKGNDSEFKETVEYLESKKVLVVDKEEREKTFNRDEFRNLIWMK